MFEELFRKNNANWFFIRNNTFDYKLIDYNVMISLISLKKTVLNFYMRSINKHKLLK